jgi:type I restriction enzyme, S subunit
MTSGRHRLLGDAKSSAGQQGVSGSDLKDQPVPLPSVAEQREIVQRSRALLGLVGVVEERLGAASATAEKITQSVLAKAFRGELVPTEAELARAQGRDYEPASDLLKRIQGEREANGSSGNKRGRKPPTSKGRRRRSKDVDDHAG